VMQESPQLVWPLRVEFIHLAQLAPLIGSSLYPYVLYLSPQHPAAFAVERHFVLFPPARHWGYAVQWFALALTLLILSIVFYLKGAREK
jgi:surfeit locus 1 family protein